MPFDFSFRSVQSSSDIRRTIDFLAKQDLTYPQYQEWVARAEAELFSGYKRAALAYSEGFLVGDIVWQAHKQFSRVREIKQIRVLPKIARRYVGSFLARQIECEDRGSFDAILADAPETQTDAIAMMESLGYLCVGKLNLYQETRKDVVLFKDFTRNPKSKLWIRKELKLAA